MARRHKHYLGRALAVSLALHAAVLSLQFGPPGKGWPSLGWTWGERKASVPLPVLRAELRRPLPVETAPAAAVDPANATAAIAIVNPVPSPTSEAITARMVAARAPVAPPVLQRDAPVPVVRAKEPRKATGGVALLSVEKDSEWHIAAADAAREAEERDRAAQAAAEVAEAAEAEEANDRARQAELGKQRIAAEQELERQQERVQREAAEALRKTREEALDRQRAEAATRRAAEELELQAQRTAAERAAAQARLAGEQAEQASQRAREEAQRLAQAAEAQRKAEQVALAQRAAEEAKQAEEMVRRKRAEALANEQRRLEQAALARAAADAQERRRAEALAVAAEEQRKAAQAAQAAQAAEEKRSQEQAAIAKAQAEAQAAAAELSRQAELGRAASAAAALRGARQEKGAALASRALDMVRSGLPLKPPVEAESPPDKPRRGSILGRNPAEIQLSFYGESWAQKIERIASLNYPRLSRNRLYGPLVISVSINSDGTLAGLRILKSSGNRELDEAARRIVEMCAPFAAFPPDLKRNYDSVEITRTLTFPERPPLLITQ